MTSIGSKKSTVWYAASQGIYGEITRDLSSAWLTRLGEDAKIVLEDKIQPLFNDIGLFPSKSQINTQIFRSEILSTYLLLLNS